MRLIEQIVLLALAAVALALGLGGRDVAGGILAGYFVRQRFQPGDDVTVLSYKGTVREVGLVATVVETEEEGLPYRHSIPNHVMLKEAIR